MRAALWAGLIGCLFAWNVHEHAFIGDDAYISFRYADHLVRGEGLVWNVGERVEGYTNFLWVLLAALWLAIGIPPEVGAHTLSILSGAGVLVTLAALARREHGRVDGFALAMLATLAASRSFTAWCTGGLETMFFTFLVLLAFVRLMLERAGEQREAGWALSPWIFALAALTRPEGLLFAAAGGALGVIDWLRGERSMQALLRWSLPLIAVVGAHFTFRWLYYGELLPNTFYAKVSGAWLSQALTYLGLFGREYTVLPFLPLMGVGLLRPARSASRIFLGVLTPYLAYVLYIGGDRFEFRFLVVVFPFFYWLLFDGARKLSELIPSDTRRSRAARVVGWSTAAALLATTALGSREESQIFHRHGLAGLHGIERYANGRIEQGRFLRARIDAGELPSELTIAVGGAGALPYFTRWTTVDRHGLNDRYIARLPVLPRAAVGHRHDAPFDYLKERDVIVFDVFNRLIHPGTNKLEHRYKRFHDGHPIALRAIALQDRYLVFGTLVSDERLSEIFQGHEILKPRRDAPAAASESADPDP